MSERTKAYAKFGGELDLCQAGFLADSLYIYRLRCMNASTGRFALRLRDRLF
jgi:hypothetical protein